MNSILVIKDISQICYSRKGINMYLLHSKKFEYEWNGISSARLKIFHNYSLPFVVQVK
jgi:hypothetical protein